MKNPMMNVEGAGGELATICGGHDNEVVLGLE